ncbi:hypothetical protein NP565_23820, partial [Vibrio parahaemolyticus]|nr:hypothetical protein [Vibrio parahaemolyticus]
RDIVIFARSDARATGGLEEVVGRLNACFEAGADAAFFGERYSERDLEFLSTHLTKPLAVVGGIPGWPSIAFARRQAFEDLGVRFVFYSFSS